MRDVNSSGIETEPLGNAGDLKSIVFGFGGRLVPGTIADFYALSIDAISRLVSVRPGLHLADATIWLSIACVLASLTFCHRWIRRLAEWSCQMMIIFFLGSQCEHHMIIWDSGVT